MGIRRTITRGFTSAFIALVMVSCGGNPPPPEPGTTRGVAPDLRGQRVVVLPVQQNAGVAGDVDAEMAFGLQGRTREVTWIFGAEVEEVLARSPSISARTRGLPVGHFLQAEVQRVGDPLFGDFRRISALLDAGAILLPVQVAMGTAEIGEPHRMAELIDVPAALDARFLYASGALHIVRHVLSKLADQLVRELFYLHTKLVSTGRERIIKRFEVRPGG